MANSSSRNRPGGTSHVARLEKGVRLGRALRRTRLGGRRRWEENGVNSVLLGRISAHFFGSRFALSSSSDTSLGVPPGGTSSLAVQRMALSTRRRKFVVAPVGVVVAAGEAEAAAAVGPLDGPGQHFGAALARDVLVRAPGRRRRSLAGLVVGLGDEDRRHALHLGPEPDVEVPLVADRERLHAARDRVLGQALDVGVPVRVGREAGLVVAADPVEEPVAGLALGHLDGVVQADQADALLS